MLLGWFDCDTSGCVVTDCLFRCGCTCLLLTVGLDFVGLPNVL